MRTSTAVDPVIMLMIGFAIGAFGGGLVAKCYFMQESLMSSSVAIEAIRAGLVQNDKGMWVKP